MFSIFKENDTNKGRDKKPWYKPSKLFKDMEKRERRAKEREALRQGKEIPFFKHTDVWNYT